MHPASSLVKGMSNKTKFPNVFKTWGRPLHIFCFDAKLRFASFLSNAFYRLTVCRTLILKDSHVAIATVWQVTLFLVVAFLHPRIPTQATLFLHIKKSDA